MLVDCPLHRVQVAVLGDALDCRHLAAVRLDGKKGARFHGLAVEPDRARPAVGSVAANVGAGQVQVLTQQVDEQRPRFGLCRPWLPVDGDGDGALHRALLRRRGCAVAKAGLSQYDADHKYAGGATQWSRLVRSDRCRARRTGQLARPAVDGELGAALRAGPRFAGLDSAVRAHPAVVTSHAGTMPGAFPDAPSVHGNACSRTAGALRASEGSARSRA